jgi:hypothetical protein
MKTQINLDFENLGEEFYLALLNMILQDKKRKEAQNELQTN